MLFCNSHTYWLAILLASSIALAPLSRTTPNDPPAPQAPLALTSQQQDQVRDLASRVLKHADKAGCKKSSCTILVANFTGPSGSTSMLGMQLADAVSAQLTAQSKGIQIAARGRLQSYLESERIPAAILNNDKAIRWLGKHLGATAILTGTIELSGSSLRVRARVLSCEKDKPGPEEAVSFSYAGSAEDLKPAEPFAPELPTAEAFSSPAVLQAGKGGSKPPSCVYCPEPSYTDPARLAKFSGSAVLDVVVSAEGLAGPIRIVRGLPFGLNQASMDAVRHWRFKPSELNGQPVTVRVAIEVSFRLY
ncbi:MAG TPA: TonB family protein [Candidatus Angelobacter sp.]|nr:TonB family protein [Candidatus Angelobacter sp.]